MAQLALFLLAHTREFVGLGLMLVINSSKGIALCGSVEQIPSRLPYSHPSTRPAAVWLSALQTGILCSCSDLSFGKPPVRCFPVCVKAWLITFPALCGLGFSLLSLNC